MKTLTVFWTGGVVFFGLSDFMYIRIVFNWELKYLADFVGSFLRSLVRARYDSGYSLMG